MRMHQGRPVLTVEGVDTMDAAETLAGVELRVPESALAPLPDGTYYEHDLIGCALVTTDGREVGRVRTVEGGGGMIRLIAGAGREEIQVPLVHEICVAIDIAGKRIVIDPPRACWTSTRDGHKGVGAATVAAVNSGAGARGRRATPRSSAWSSTS